MATDPEILFHWKAPTSDFAQRLLIAVIAAISIHGLCFYVFQIQEPESPHTLPRKYGVTYLSQGDPTARLILQQIDDYYAAYDGTLLADSELNMAVGSADYVASYSSLEVQLMPLPERKVVPLEELGPKDSVMVQPAIPAWAPPEEAKASSSSASDAAPGITLIDGLRLVLPDEWRGRYLGSPGAGWAGIQQRPPAEGGRVSARLSVLPNGQVDEVVMLSKLGQDDSGKVFQDALKSMAFTPRVEGLDGGGEGVAVWLETVYLEWE